MDERIAKIIRGIKSLAELAQFEKNAAQRHALTDEVKEAIRARSIEFGRLLVAERTGLDLTNLSPAEEKIVLAAAEYAGIKKRLGSNATRTFMQVRNRGLIGAAEASVIKSKPTQGFETLADAELEDLSYEQIVVDHPNEFSARAQWFARRTLGLPNETAAPAASGVQGSSQSKTKNPDWTRDELILALDLYMRSRDSVPSKDSAEVVDLSSTLRKMAHDQDTSDTYRNHNGVYMKLNNFKRLDPRYVAEGKTGLERGSKLEESIWQEFADDPASLVEAAQEVRSRVP